MNNKNNDEYNDSTERLRQEAGYLKIDVNIGFNMSFHVEEFTLMSAYFDILIEHELVPEGLEERTFALRSKINRLLALGGSLNS